MRTMKLRAFPLLALLGAWLLAGCERRPLEDGVFQTALIPVKIDWSKSGFAPDDPAAGERIHRVSLRFFPKDGSEPFDRYLEGNVTEGEIAIPTGEYNIVVFNESIHDAYWSDQVYFTDVDDFHRFAANKHPDHPDNHPFYNSLPGEELVVEPLRLASWSLGDFAVTREMVTRTRAAATRGEALTQAGDDCQALTCIVMRPLAYNINVKATVLNLCSASMIQGAMRGFASKVYMASAVTVPAPSTHVFKFNGRTWDDGDMLHGTTRRTFLSFAHQPEPSDYHLNLDVLFGTGELFDPAQWPAHNGQSLLYDVSDQVNAAKKQSSGVSVDIDIDITLPLPYVAGGIGVGDWDDEEIQLQ